MYKTKTQNQDLELLPIQISYYLSRLVLHPKQLITPIQNIFQFQCIAIFTIFLQPQIHNILIIYNMRVQQVQPHQTINPLQSLPILSKLIDEQTYKRSLIQVPLQFEFQPVEILSKELTKLNNTSEFRVVYLGARWAHNHSVHKSLSDSENHSQVAHPQQFGLDKLQKYKINMNPKEKTYIMRVTNPFVIERNTIYYRAFEGMNPTIKGKQDQLIFNSHFQSGNLDCAVKVNNNEYDLFLRIDSNTRGHVLWYYFSISNKNKRRVKINICNMMKSGNLYSKNMRPYVFSVKKHKQQGTDWQQGCENIKYQQKQLRYEFIYEKINVRPLYQLSFDYEFQYEQDTVFFAYCVPYTYSMLRNHIHSLKQKTSNLNIMEVESIGSSLLGVQIPLLKITDSSVPLQQKKIVLVTGRIHPGQSCGSFMVAGLLEYLCSKQAAQLRRSTVFIVIPMMNPDGVILGNYRTGVSGVDLNRIFHKMNKQIYPEVYYLKTLVKKVSQIQPVLLYFDFHGHSSKKNAFSYGPSYKIIDTQYYKAKLLPKLISIKIPMFRFYSCIFRITEGKKDTARSIFFHQYNIPYTYTIEASNGSFYDQDQKQTFDFSRLKWQDVGSAFGPSIFQFLQMFTQDRRQMIQTVGGISRKRFSSPRKITSDDLNIFQQSIEVVSKTSKNRYQTLIDEIKNDEKKHKKEEEDSEVSSDDDDPINSLPKTKLAKLGNAIVQNTLLVENNQELNPKKTEQTVYQKERKVDHVLNRKYQFLNKSRRIKLQKSKIDKKQIISKISENGTIARQFHPQNYPAQTSHRPLRNSKEKTMVNWKGYTQDVRRSTNQRNVSTSYGYRNHARQVQMSLDVDQLMNKDQQQIKEIKRQLELSYSKVRNRTRSLSQTQKRKKKLKQPAQSFLYPQVFHFDEFMEQNQKRLTKMSRQQDQKNRISINKKITTIENTKTSCPSAFYKIKQNLHNKKKEDSYTTLEKNNVFVIDIKKV